MYASQHWHVSNTWLPTVDDIRDRWNLMGVCRATLAQPPSPHGGLGVGGDHAGLPAPPTRSSPPFPQAPVPSHLLPETSQGATSCLPAPTPSQVKAREDQGGAHPPLARSLGSTWGDHCIPKPHKNLLPGESFFSYLLKTTSGGEHQEKRKSRCQPVTQNNHFAHCLYFPTNFVFFKKDNKTIVLSAN